MTVANIMAMGFSRAQAKEALERYDGNSDRAVNWYVLFFKLKIIYYTQVHLSFEI